MTDQSTPERSAALDAAEVTTLNRTGFGAALGLEFLELTADAVRAQWTVTPTQHQPYGIVHGGVYCAVIETIASMGGAIWFGDRGNVVGVNNNTDFLRATREGVLTAVGTPIHRGRTQQLWRVVITDAQDRVVSQGQVRLANIEDSARIGN
ncbi:PaaI family thioesterase [Rhodococcus artemisiae]|uniref:PaaI family thioesterase n=1 Tax=Rhodococcus artemisiae TaxID=714159 RepID=A0ABU7LKY2_9NOCA|nr:PaaI family thioesterase [Rhodococcus artemisiae]MEE2061874.1 PaaI family thioesterase [Rhodococcus artemisiae]